MSVNTRSAPRRRLALGSLAELRAELDRIESAHRAGSLRTTGNWTAGQILEHVALLMEHSIDGFPARLPGAMRLLGKLVFKRSALAGKPPPSGFAIPDRVSFLRPDDHTSFEQGLARIGRALDRIESGERFAQPSPLFGPLTHEQWERIHCGHAAMHLGFMDY